MSTPTFRYARTIHFADTDAAGVVFFARYLAIAHEAYEEALLAINLPLAQFFSTTGLVIPIAKSEASYRRPLACGDPITIDVTPTRLSDHSFAVDYVVWTAAAAPKRAALIRTEHVCINGQTRQRQALPPALATWVDGPSA